MPRDRQRGFVQGPVRILACLTVQAVKKLRVTLHPGSQDSHGFILSQLFLCVVFCSWKGERVL